MDFFCKAEKGVWISDKNLTPAVWKHIADFFISMPTLAKKHK
jgi:hypothetical protein